MNSQNRSRFPSPRGYLDFQSPTPPIFGNAAATGLQRNSKPPLSSEPPLRLGRSGIPKPPYLRNHRCGWAASGFRNPPIFGTTAAVGPQRDSENQVPPGGAGTGCGSDFSDLSPAPPGRSTHHKSPVVPPFPWRSFSALHSGSRASARYGWRSRALPSPGAILCARLLSSVV